MVFLEILQFLKRGLCSTGSINMAIHDYIYITIHDTGVVDSASRCRVYSELGVCMQHAVIQFPCQNVTHFCLCS